MPKPHHQSLEYARKRAYFKLAIIAIIIVEFNPRLLCAQSGWMPLMNETYRAIAVGSQCDMVASADGKILRSNDHGKSWSLILYDTGSQWSGICKYSDSDFAVVGYSGMIMVSSHGAKEWHKIQFLPSVDWSAVASSSPGSLIVVGSAGASAFSTDGGISWHQTVTNTPTYLHAVSFGNGEVAIAVGNNGTILRSTDRGNSWSSVQSSTTESLWSICFRDSVHIAMTGQHGALLLSSDAGLHWQSSSVDDLDHYVIRFVGDSTIVLAGFGNAALRSKNLGRSWDTAYYYQISKYLSVWSMDEDHGVLLLAGAEGLIASSPDTGLTWYPIAFSRTSDLAAGTKNYFSDIVWGDSSTCYVTADYSNVFKSNNGGDTWLRLNNFPFMIDDILAAHFWTKDCGFVAGTNAALFSTSDGGSTWNEVGNRIVHLYMGLSMPSPSNYIFIANDSCVISTPDLIRWNVVVPGVCKELSDISFPTAEKGFIAGYSWTGTGYDDTDTYYSHILRSSDSGKTWVAVYSDTGFGGKLFFLSPDTGFFAGGSNGLYRTFNGGTTWELVFQPINGVSGVYFLNAREGYATDGNTNIYHTTDSGVDWQNDARGGQWLRISPKGDLFSGSSGFVMKKTLSKDFNPANVAPHPSEMNSPPQAYLWLYAWPNPASGRLHFQAYISPERRSYTKLLVMDMLGRQIMDLTSSIRPIGNTFESDFDADVSGLPEGAYNFVLTSGNNLFSRVLIVAH